MPICTLFLFLPLPARAGAGQILTKDTVEAAIRSYVLQQGPWQPTQLEVKVHAFTPLFLPAGRMAVRVVHRREVTPGSRTFLLAVEVEGQEVTRVWVRAAIRIFGEVVVTSRPLAHYEVIVPDAVRLERRDISALSTRAFTQIEEVVGQLAARAIEVNTILTPSMVEQPRVLRRGSEVRLLYETSSLRVETPGQALEGGKVGDRVRVKNSSSGKVLEGQILDARTVRVN
jgi:flagella basal body P-ring formation protein FlgA